MSKMHNVAIQRAEALLKAAHVSYLIVLPDGSHLSHGLDAGIPLKQGKKGPTKKAKATPSVWRSHAMKHGYREKLAGKAVGEVVSFECDDLGEAESLRCSIGSTVRKDVSAGAVLTSVERLYGGRARVDVLVMKDLKDYRSYYVR